MATLDFSELDKDPPGEAFEALVRMIGERLGLVVQWSGRGPDGGRDLLFLETQNGPIVNSQIKWLVSCKDNSQSGASVFERDVGSVIDKIYQHKCDGFLLATTTTASAALKERLNSLDIASGGSIRTKVWDRFELTNYILDAKFSDLYSQYFPKQFRKPTSLDDAVKLVESSLPRFSVGEVRRYLIPYTDRLESITGTSVWPHDTDQMRIIDSVRNDAVHIHKIEDAARRICELNFEPFMAFLDSLIRNFPSNARRILRVIARGNYDSGILFNVLEILREDEEFSFEEELEITRSYDYELLFDLYHDLVVGEIGVTGAWIHRLPSSAANYDDIVELEDVDAGELEFVGGDGVTFTGIVKLTVRGSSLDPDRPGSSKEQFTYRVQGEVLSDGVDITEIGG